MTAIRTIIRGNKFTLIDIQDFLFEKDCQYGNKSKSLTRKANNLDLVILNNAKSTKRKGVYWDCGVKGYYRDSNKCKEFKKRNKSENRDYSKA